MDLDLALDQRMADGDAALDELQSECVHVGGGRHLDESWKLRSTKISQSQRWSLGIYGLLRATRFKSCNLDTGAAAGGC